MIAQRQKRLLLGLLAAVAPLPLPFNEPRPQGVVGMGYLAAYLAFVVYFFVRAYRDRVPELRLWQVNLLGLLYVPYLILDVTLLWQGNLVRPMMHLALFAVAVKLWSMRDDRDKWQVLLGVFFIFLTSMATSTHPSIVLYLVVFAALALLLLTRFTYFHLQGLESARGRLILGPRSIKRYVLGFTILAAMAAVPIFVLLPRLRDPFLLGGGQGSGGNYGTGFSDQVTLDVIGNIRTSREVALRAQVENEDAVGEFRLKGATYDRYVGRSWIQSSVYRVESPMQGVYRLNEGEAVNTMKIWLQPLRARSLILPVETLSLDLDVPVLQRDYGGALSLFYQPRETLEYSVDLAAGQFLAGRPADPSDAEDFSLNEVGFSERIRALAVEVAGEGTVEEQARRIESHLISEYEYTLDFLRRSAEQPIEDFLFTYRSGHCEYFASSMVLMLRSIGIPARFVTGFLGAEYNPLEGYYVVRQSNAHAWVEAYLPEIGWRTFDPTPPSGRPTAEMPSLGLLLRQSWDFVVFRWDRYIIAFTAEDQARILARWRQRLADWWQGRGENVDVADGPAPAEPPAAPTRRLSPWLTLLVGLVLTALLGFGAWQTRPSPSARRAWVLLRHRARRSGVTLDGSTPPREARLRMVARYPTLATPSGRLLELYLRESFRGDLLKETEREEVVQALSEARETLREASRRRDSGRPKLLRRAS